MPSPFPGMDPWLEDTAVWTGFHNSFLVYLRDQLRPKLAPRFIASVEDRVWVQSAFPERHVKPDLWIRERRKPTGENGGVAVAPPARPPLIVRLRLEECRETYLEILDRETGMSVVTCIELVSPTNKHPGPGRDTYLRKQAEVLASQTNLVEIDLLRGGQRTIAYEEQAGAVNYSGMVGISIAGTPRETLLFYPIELRERLPCIVVPLLGVETSVDADLQSAFDQSYESGDYGERLRYDRPCEPPMTVDETAWACERLKAAGLNP